MGGGVNAKTRELLRKDDQLAELINWVETRKVIMPLGFFVEDGTLEEAIKVELELLTLRTGSLEKTVASASGRVAQIRARV
jgi:hypothetical protein